MLVKTIRVLAVAVCSLAFVNMALAQDSDNSTFSDVELPPVKRIVLYNSGVGQLQHEGEVEGNAKVTLKFAEHDASDALKSLAISDSGGGSTRAIEYQPAPDPEDVAASELGQPMTIAQLLQSMRGETVVLSRSGESVEGTIFGVESRREGEVNREMVVLIDDSGIGAHQLSDFSTIKFAKEELNEKLALALRGVVKSRTSGKKELKILLAGDGKRDVKFAYVVDMPIWRMTYRLLWAKDTAYLQGWAHVDNVSAVDWSDVALELRSGKPSSFHTNVFSPAMANRTDIGNSVYEFMDGLDVVTKWFGSESTQQSTFGGFGGPYGGGGSFGGGGLGGGGGGFFGGGGVFGRAEAGSDRSGDGVDAKAGFENLAETEKVSQMVVYRISEPVSLKAGTSAAIPAFEVELPGEIVSVADLVGRKGGVTPVQAIELENNTEFSLLSGPVSVMRNGNFAGDGELPRVDVQQKEYVNFGIDRPVTMKESNVDMSMSLSSIKRIGGKLEETWRNTREVTYQVVNLDVDDRVVLVKTPRESSNEKEVEPKPYRTTDDRLIFKVNAKAGETKDLKVVFKYERQTSKSWTDWRDLRTDRWDKLGITPPEKDLAFMRKVIALNQKILEETEASLTQQQQRNLAETEQERIRDNLKVFKPGSKDAEPIVAKFVEIENEIAKRDAALAKSQATLKELKEMKAALLK